MIYHYFDYLGSTMNHARCKIDVKSRIVLAKSTVRKNRTVSHEIPTKPLNTLTPLYSHYTLLHVSARGQR